MRKGMLGLRNMLMRRKALLGLVFVTIAAGVLVVGVARTKAQESPINLVSTRILGQREWYRGSRASLRVIAKDQKTGLPLRARIRIVLLRNAAGPRGEEVLFSGLTETGTGSVSPEFDVPDVAPGKYKLRIEVISGTLRDSAEADVQIIDRTRIMLVTDKPVYQPGQVIHMRALALGVPARHPAADQPLTFEVEDAKGNKVFKQEQRTSRFGVASADFQLASEVNMGCFTLRAVLHGATEEKKVTVDRYVLPKFKVAITTDRKFYLPGDTVAGSVDAQYFFGKPVAGGSVEIEASSFDVETTKVAEVHGSTSDDGKYRFEFPLPQYLVGQALEQGKGSVLLQAKVRDRADHTETANISVPVAKEPIVILAIPEGGTLKRGLENVIYISTSYPDGTPAVCDLQISTQWTRTRYFLQSDPLGIAAFPVKPLSDSTTLTVRASDSRGARASVSVPLSVQAGEDALILRTNRSLASVGDVLTADVISTVSTGAVYFDIIRDGQTILTRAADLANGKAAISLTVDPSLTGTIHVNAYTLNPSEQIVRDSRIVYVNPAADLKVDVHADHAIYRPGDKGTVDFNVRDRQNHPVLAALGVAVVDESVFALQEMQPGLERIYFTLEKELMTPKYEIHGLTPADLVLGGEPPVPMRDAAMKQEAARVLFAGVAADDPFTLSVDSYGERISKYKDRWQETLQSQADAIWNALQQYRTKHGKELTLSPLTLSTLVASDLLKSSQTRDQWKTTLRLIGTNWYDAKLESAGPDLRWGTVDDLSVDLQRRILFEGLAAEAPMAAMGGGGMGGMVRKDELEERAVAAPRPTDAVAATAMPPAAPAAAPVRLREYFPETMYWNPAVLTDAQGHARVDLNMADSITTWRLTALASGVSGALGSTTAPLRVFQDFFIDIDLPVALTDGDEVAIPVAVYNYLKTSQDVALSLERGDWFDLVDEAGASQGDAAYRQVAHLAAGEVTVRYFRIRVKRFGTFSLTVRANGAKMSDAIKRDVTVNPNGEVQYRAISDRLEGPVTHTVTIPKQAIDGASTIFVRLYPGAFSQIVDGLDAMLRMPSGCFEQTSSTTYPNVMVLDYLKRTKQIKPEIQMKADQYINVGYQRLVSFEVNGGGFSWFGNPPANQVLTAYGLMEFADMSRVHAVDPALIARTQRWLAGRQQPDGTWKKDEGGIAEGIINRQTDTLRVTAYIAWALADSGYKGPELAKAASRVSRDIGKVKDAYAMAVIANALVAIAPQSQSAHDAIDALAKMAVETDKVAYWPAAGETMTRAHGDSADLETTGLAAYALLKSRSHGGLTNKALTYLVQKKDAFGTWETTQATVWAFKALLLATETSTSTDTNAEVSIDCNGKHVGAFALTPEDADVMRQLDLKPQVRAGDNKVQISFSGKGSCLYQIVSKYYLPWKGKVAAAQSLLDIAVKFDKTELQTDDTVTETVTVTNRTKRRAEMVVIDLGVPPGFQVQTGDLDEFVGTKITRYDVAGRQIIVYLDHIDAGKNVELTYRLKAKYPLKARTPETAAYEYYNPKDRVVSAPVQLIVTKR